MMDNFAPSLAHVLASEGGYVDNRHDPGGATNQGITQNTYDIWRTSHRQMAQDVRLIDPNEVEAIYRQNYWNAVHGDDLPHGVDYCVFDCAVNSGPHEAALWLQRAAGVDDDGVIGPGTLAAVNAADPRRLINSICAERLAFMQQHCDWADFGDGWTNRVNSVEMTARGMT